MNADPHWLDAANGDYRLAADSPLIDRGAARAAAQGETDRAGNPRVVDGNGDGATARDIGAYEYLPPAAEHRRAAHDRHAAADRVHGRWASSR